MKTKSSLLPEPRSYAGTAIMIGAITALPFAVLWSWLFAAMQDQSFGEILPFGLLAGLLFGLVFGLTMAAVFKAETASVAVSDKQHFISTVNSALSQFGYTPASQFDDFFTYKPSFQAGLVAGTISVQLTEQQAVIVGPKIYVNKLFKYIDNPSG
jgi:hypothetical protein